MLRFYCDHCGKELLANDKDRYVVVVDIRPGSVSSDLTEDDLSDDNLTKVSELLQHSEMYEDVFDPAGPVKIRHDLCGACRDRFLKDPFQRHASESLDFSNN